MQADQKKEIDAYEKKLLRRARRYDLLGQVLGFMVTFFVVGVVLALGWVVFVLRVRLAAQQ